MLVLGRAETTALLAPDDLREAIAGAMVAVSARTVSMPSRIAAAVPAVDGLLAAMPAAVDGRLGAKLVSVFPRNEGSGVPSHQAVIVVFDPATGTPLALVDGTSITAARTAAGSALSVELLARPDATALAIVGTGVQARSHALAVTRVRDFAEVRIVGRDAQRAAALAAELDGLLAPRVVAAESVAGADVVCTATHATEPVIHRDDLAPGTHVASVGLNFAGRELDSRTIADALVVVESVDAALAPPPSGANDLRIPLEEGLVTTDDLSLEIGAIVAGDHPGRTDPSQLTVYKSVGVAVQDVAAAALVLDGARRTGAGVEIEM